MLSRIRSGTVVGLQGTMIEVEVDVADRGFPTFTIVGLASKAIDEAKERVRTAVVHAGFEMPDSRITVNLAPADIPKTGSGFDLPIAVGILASSGVVGRDQLAMSLFVGELSLEGSMRSVTGVISLMMMARDAGITAVYLPEANAPEASYIEGIAVYPVRNLQQLVLHLNGQSAISVYPYTPITESSGTATATVDFTDIRGQAQAKRGLEIAAAGFHNIHLKGPPGAGKTLLSRAFSGLLPPLAQHEVLAVSQIYSVAGLLTKGALMTNPPFRSPHHTTSRIGLIGGGTNPAPGEITLAHKGILFLDELTEFPRNVLESLRQPLEDGQVTVARAAGSVTFPARFLLLAASNPCPCGYRGHPTRACVCHAGAVAHYQKKLSGPLMDRIDIHMEVSPVDAVSLTTNSLAEPSDRVRKRVLAARERQRRRLERFGKLVNGDMTSANVRDACQVSGPATDLLRQAVSKLSLSGRSYFKLLKVSQTIADLGGADVIDVPHVAEALQYRSQDQQ